MSQETLVSENDFISTYKDTSQASNQLKRLIDVLPLYESEELAKIIAALLADGHLQKKKYYNSYKYTYLGFFSDNPEDIERFESNFFSIFRVKGHTRKWGERVNGNSTGHIVINAPICRILELSGAIAGNKTKTSFSVPLWIKNSNSSIKAAFLNELFTCEGSVTFDSFSKRWEIRFFTNKEEKLRDNVLEYLDDLKNLLYEFGIKSNFLQKHRKIEKTLEFELRIRDKNSIVNFKRFINFGNKQKREKLERAVSWAEKKGPVTEMSAKLSLVGAPR